MSLEGIEAARERYRPEKVRCLFVGECPPMGGTFFYYGDSHLAKYTREAFASASFPSADMRDFLLAFQVAGCYLVDLCPEPVGALSPPLRQAAREAGVPQLAKTIGRLRPEAVVVVTESILRQVAEALVTVGLSGVSRYVLPFPGEGHEMEYVAELAALVKRLGIRRASA